jgi:hypothetical protein
MGLVRQFRYRVAAGGVEQATDSAFDLDKALQRELDAAFIRMGRELVLAGYITLSERRHDGDYVAQTMLLSIPEGEH